VGELARAERHLLTARRLGLLEHGATPGRLARIAWVRGDLAKAELEASRALDAGLDPERPELLLLRGRARLRLGNVADGRRDLGAALDQSPELAVGWNDLALSYANAGEPAAAKRLFEQAAARFPRDASFAYNAGYAAALAGDLGGAESLFRETLGRDPGFRVARENLAGLMASQGRTAEAIELLEQGLALEDHPEMRAMVEELRAAGGHGEGGTGGAEGGQ
jgi:Flp pilus assembly protein TadD